MRAKCSGEDFVIVKASVFSSRAATATLKWFCARVGDSLSVDQLDRNELNTQFIFSFWTLLKLIFSTVFVLLMFLLSFEFMLTCLKGSFAQTFFQATEQGYDLLLKVIQNLSGMPPTGRVKEALKLLNQSKHSFPPWFFGEDNLLCTSITMIVMDQVSGQSGCSCWHKTWASLQWGSFLKGDLIFRTNNWLWKTWLCRVPWCCSVLKARRGIAFRSGGHWLVLAAFGFNTHPFFCRMYQTILHSFTSENFFHRLLATVIGVSVEQVALDTHSIFNNHHEEKKVPPVALIFGSDSSESSNYNK